MACLQMEDELVGTGRCHVLNVGLWVQHALWQVARRETVSWAQLTY